MSILLSVSRKDVDTEFGVVSVETRFKIWDEPLDILGS